MNVHRPDIALLFSTRIVRLFAYGFLSVVLVLYLVQVGLMIVAGIVFLITGNIVLLIAAAIIGVISPSGSEIGPFLSIEQASLTQLLPDSKRTQAFAWYNLSGSIATAFGALTGGGIAQLMQAEGSTAIAAYRVVLMGYALSGIVLIALFTRLSSGIEARQAAPAQPYRLGLSPSSRGIVARLSALFALDAFAGGLVVQSLIAFWFSTRFGVEVGVVGAIFFGANILAGISALSAASIARRVGLINTMVFTHLPSNVLLMLVPVMPTLPLAVIALLLRFSISQMDVPARQSYVMAVVKPDERSAASGVTAIARSAGGAISPVLSGIFLANASYLALPFFLAGGLKIVYDLLLYRGFKSTKPPEEMQTQSVVRI